MPFEWLVGLRYTRGGKPQRAQPFHFLHLAHFGGRDRLGVAALIIVLSVMNGFQKQVTDRMLSVLAHVEVFDARGDMPQVARSGEGSLRNPAVRGAAPFVASAGPAAARRRRCARCHPRRAAEPKRNVSEVANTMRQGQLRLAQPGSFNIVLGYALASALNVQVGDKVTMLLAQAQATPAGMLPRMRSFTVSAFSSPGHNEFDAGMAFITSIDAKRWSACPRPPACACAWRTCTRAAGGSRAGRNRCRATW
jgi:lipoprotein-releasing system permease protein